MEEEHDLSTVLGLEGCDEEYTDVSEFTNYLGANHPVSRERFGVKWVFWETEAYQKSPIIQNKIKTLVSKEIWHTGLIQFWAPKVDGKSCYLTTSDQPFAVDGLYKGICWYRKHCMDHGDISVDDGAKEEQLGAVGRVYLNGYPESSPDLRLYSTKELPLKDYAARCGAKAYLVLPVFDLLKKECYGVLECLGFLDVRLRRNPNYMVQVERALQKAELRTTHLRTDQTAFDERKNLTEGATMMVRDEITKMLEAAEKMVPQLHMAHVWIPCKQCANTTTALCCMELVSSRQRSTCEDDDITNYFKASKFHRLQLRKGIIAKKVMSSSNIKSCFCRNICYFSQSEYPLAHYVQKSRLSFCFAICLECVHNNDLYYVEFFLQPNSAQDPCGVSLCHLLMGAIRTVLKSFKVILSDVLEVRKDMLSNSIKVVPHKMSGTREGGKHQYSKEPSILTNMNGCLEMYPSKLEFQKYLKMEDEDFSCLKSREIDRTKWLFWGQEGEQLCGNDENYSPFLQNSTQEKIKGLLHNLMQSKHIISLFSLVQFWAPKMDEDRCYLAASDQTFALFGLYKGLTLFRKRCLTHQYFVDEGAEEEELGPIGRVFRSGHPEMTHDLRLYSTTGFPLKNDAAFCNLKSYIAFPIFDHQHKCLGVLEFIGVLANTEDTLKCIQNAVQDAHLSSTHMNNEPKFHGGLALSEVKKGLQLVNKIPQLHAVEVWVPHKNCASTRNSLTCIHQVISNSHTFGPVETGKGIVGSVLESENKCCYCQNSCQFSVSEQSLSHHAQQKRLDVCFAICLRSSHTGDLPFVLKFLLNQGPGHYDYLWSFLYYLLPILKQQLKSFKVAMGKQLGDKLVVDIIEFSPELNRPTSLQFGQPDLFPVKFQIVHYGQQKHQGSNDQQANEMDHVTSAVAEGNKCTTPVANLEKEEETSRRIEKGKTSTGQRINLENLEGQFGKSREDAAENLSVSISTFKRACRDHGIHRWPSSKKQRKNPSLHMTKNANAYDGDPQQSTGLSSRSLRPPLHQNVLPTDTKSNQNFSMVPEADQVIIKARYEDEIVKFQFCLSSGLVNLCKEVATRLELEMGSFELQYVDEDNDHISLTCDADLQFYVESTKVAGKNCISVSVQLMG